MLTVRSALGEAKSVHGTMWSMHKTREKEVMKKLDRALLPSRSLYRKAFRSLQGRRTYCEVSSMRGHVGVFSGRARSCAPRLRKQA